MCVCVCVCTCVCVCLVARCVCLSTLGENEAQNSVSLSFGSYLVLKVASPFSIMGWLCDPGRPHALRLSRRCEGHLQHVF